MVRAFFGVFVALCSALFLFWAAATGVTAATVWFEIAMILA
jgi:hypothetical protein